MVDLNLWRLEYDETALEFGTHESGHPFIKQVVVGPVDIETDDMVHPLSDGTVFGEDHTRGRALGFAGVHLSTQPMPSSRRWTRPMDDSSVFERAWRARSVRSVPGKVATLANLDRGRFVYGRPRPYMPDHERARHGWLTYACVFDTVDDRFYSTTEKVVTIGVDPPSLSAMTFPVTFPFTGATPSTSRTYLYNAGTDDAWPVVTFRDGTDPQLELLNEWGGVEWALKVKGTIGAGGAVTVDTRPWVRQVTKNGTAAPGVLRGTRITDMGLPPGTHELRLTAIDPTGQAEVEVRWHDAYGTL